MTIPVGKRLWFYTGGKIGYYFLNNGTDFGIYNHDDYCLLSLNSSRVPTITNGVSLSTTTPPQEYDLPLADGFSVWGVCSYFKTQDNIVTLNVNISNTLVTAGNEVIIGNLPAGFRPIGNVIAAAYCNGAGCIYIDYLGVIRMRGVADWTLGHASVTFRAY